MQFELHRGKGKTHEQVTVRPMRSKSGRGEEPPHYSSAIAAAETEKEEHAFSASARM